MKTLLVTVNSLRYDYYDHLDATQAYLGESHPHAYATSPATSTAVPALLSGRYQDRPHLSTETSIASQFDTTIGITATALFSAPYGYTEGFDRFDAPDATTVARELNTVAPSKPSSSRITSTARRLYERATAYVSATPKSFREAPDVLERFTTQVPHDESWFGWLHFMEPHPPYDPRPSRRVQDRRLTQTVFADDGDFDDEEQVRDLYRQELERLDDTLADLWTFIPDDTRVVFCGTHGVLLGEGFTWGHTGELRAELLRVPLATKNAPTVGDVVSLIDVPALLLGVPYRKGMLDRDTAYAISGETTAAMNEDHITRGDGVERLYTGASVDDEGLATAYAQFDATSRVAEDTEDEDGDEDTEAIGYA